MSEWAYLNTHPYRVRHRIAEHFVSGLPSVVDVGSHMRPLDIPYVVSVDPTGRTPGCFAGTVADWFDENPAGAAGVVCLGLDLSGDREVTALLGLCATARVVVAEASLEHQLGMDLLAAIVADRTPEVEMSLRLPDVTAPGYPARRDRRLVVLA